MKKWILWISLAVNVILVLLLCASQCVNYKLKLGYPSLSRKEIKKDPVESLFDFDRDGLHFLVDAYDRFIFDNTDPSLSVEEAYLRFFDENTQKIESAADADGYFRPGREYFEPVLMAHLDVLTDIWLPYAGPAIVAKNNYFPNRAPFNLELQTAIHSDFIWRVAYHNDFWKDIAESVVAGGEFGTYEVAKVMYGYHDINFSSAAERYMVALMFFIPFASSYEVELNYNDIWVWSPPNR